MIINNDFLDFQLFIPKIFPFPYYELCVSIQRFGIVILARHHRLAVAEILHIQLKTPLHETRQAKREEKEWQSHICIYIYIYIYLYTSSINHLHVRLPSLLSSNKDKLSASYYFVFSLAVEL